MKQSIHYVHQAFHWSNRSKTKPSFHLLVKPPDNKSTNFGVHIHGPKDDTTASGRSALQGYVTTEWWGSNGGVTLQEAKTTTLISGFRRDVDEICALLGYYAASYGNCIPTFWDNVSVPSSRVKSLTVISDSWHLKMGHIGCPETSVYNYHTTPRNIPEERTSQKPRQSVPLLSIEPDSYRRLCSPERETLHLGGYITVFRKRCANWREGWNKRLLQKWSGGSFIYVLTAAGIALTLMTRPRAGQLQNWGSISGRSRGPFLVFIVPRPALGPPSLLVNVYHGTFHVG
jgi:hypothetical protein